MSVFAQTRRGWRNTDSLAISPALRTPYFYLAQQAIEKQRCFSSPGFELWGQEDPAGR
jgi:hypothetical protein